MHYAVWNSEPSSSVARLSYVSANRISIDEVDINLVGVLPSGDDRRILRRRRRKKERERQFQVNLFVVVRMAVDCGLADDDCRHC